MKNIVVFENDGEIDLRSFSTFGCSVKENDGPIGFFGTGLKYALAVLLRNDHKVTVQSGEKQLTGNIRNELLRGKSFEFVYLNDQPLGFTTELGKQWELWMAYRELHCNTVDEQGTIYENRIENKVSGKTRIIVEGEQFSEVHRKKRDFLLQGEPLYKLGTLEVHAGEIYGFFYRGIRVMQFQVPAMFTYNETGRVELTEDRTVKDSYLVPFSIARQILESAPSPMLERVLTANEKWMERCLDFHGWSTTIGPDFFPAVAKLQRSSLTNLNQTALRLWREKGNGVISPRRIQPTKIQGAILEKAIAFCEQSGFRLRDEYPILVVETIGEDGVLAMADLAGKQVFLAERIFESGGTKGVARALIEEYLHLRYGFHDCTREMQNYLFGKVVSLAEELRGEPL